MYFVSRLSDEDLHLCHYAASVFFLFVTKNEAFCVSKTEMMYCYTPAATLLKMLEKMEECYSEIKETNEVVQIERPQNSVCVLLYEEHKIASEKRGMPKL